MWVSEVRAVEVFRSDLLRERKFTPRQFEEKKGVPSACRVFLLIIAKVCFLFKLLTPRKKAHLHVHLKIFQL